MIKPFNLILILIPLLNSCRSLNNHTILYKESGVIHSFADLREDTVIYIQYPFINIDYYNEKTYDSVKKILPFANVPYKLIKKGPNIFCTYLLRGVVHKDLYASYIKDDIPAFNLEYLCDTKMSYINIFTSIEKKDTQITVDHKKLKCISIIEKYPNLNNEFEYSRKVIYSKKELIPMVYIGTQKLNSGEIINEIIRADSIIDRPWHRGRPGWQNNPCLK